MFRSHHSRRMIIGLAAAAGIAGLNVLATTSAASAGIGPANPPPTVNTIGPLPVVCGVAVHLASSPGGRSTLSVMVGAIATTVRVYTTPGSWNASIAYDHKQTYVPMNPTVPHWVPFNFNGLTDFGFFNYTVTQGSCQGNGQWRQEGVS